MIQATNVFIIYEGDGTNKTFAWPYPYFDAESITPYLLKGGMKTEITGNYSFDEETKTLTYPVSGTAIESGTKLALIRETEKSQEVDLPEYYPFKIDEKAHDKTVMMVQELDEASSRSLKVEIGEDVDPTLPKPEPNTCAYWDETGKKLVADKNPNLACEEARKAASSAAVSEANAAASEEAAKTSETNAKNSETNAKASEEAAKKSETSVVASGETWLTAIKNTGTEKNDTLIATGNKYTEEMTKLADIAVASESAAAASEANAAASEANAAASEANAKASEANAKASEANAKASEANAKASEANAKASETTASAKAAAAALSAEAAANSAAGVGNPVISVTEADGTVTVTKKDSTSNTFTTGQPTDLINLSGTDATLTLTRRNKDSETIIVNNVANANACSGNAMSANKVNSAITIKSYQTGGNVDSQQYDGSAAVTVNELVTKPYADAAYLSLSGGTLTGNLAVTGDITATGEITTEGNITGAKVYNAVYNDYAEFFPRGDDAAAGDIVALDIFAHEERYIKSHAGLPPVGVVTAEFAHIIGGDKPPEDVNYLAYNMPRYVPVALGGRVHVKVAGPIKKGQYITPLAEQTGVGVASQTRAPDTVGMALEDNDEDSVKLVKMLVMR